MIQLLNLDNTEPYIKFKYLYEKAVEACQKSIDAIAISSYDKKLNEVNSRYVNLKYINKQEWIFFTNYKSPKAEQFKTHEQISALLLWDEIEVQIRMKGKIFKTNKTFSDQHFSERNKNKNAIAISSNQSEIINSYKEVLINYKNIINSDISLTNRPEYWGGFSFSPYYFEFWTANKDRINKREVYEHSRGEWVKSFLQP